MKLGMQPTSQIESGVSLKPYNSFWIAGVCAILVRIERVTCAAWSIHPSAAPKFILGGGSNIILTRDMPAVVLKVEVTGWRLVEERAIA